MEAVVHTTVAKSEAVGPTWVGPWRAAKSSASVDSSVSLHAHADSALAAGGTIADALTMLPLRYTFRQCERGSIAV